MFVDNLIVYSSYLFGMHSFGLVETNFYSQAETVARKVMKPLTRMK